MHLGLEGGSRKAARSAGANSSSALGAKKITVMMVEVLVIVVEACTKLI